MSSDSFANPHSTVFAHKARENTRARTTVVIPLYNYMDTIEAALQSVKAQSAPELSVVIVDDCSSDASCARAKAWLERNADRFASAILVTHTQNGGLSRARNTGFALAQTPFVFTLDADNLLYPRCVERCEQAIADPLAAFAYPMLEMFGSAQGLLNTQLWNRARLARGNYIDAMALIRRSAWKKAGGYVPMEHGWEDFDLWCSFAERGWHGVRVPEILARYCVHPASMLQSKTNRPMALRATARALKRRHRWLKLQH